MAREPVDDFPSDLQSAPSAMPLPYQGARVREHPLPDGMPPPEVKIAREWRVFCDGGEGALGHPRVFYTIPHDTGFADCGYCDARFIHESFVTGHAAGSRASRGDHEQPADLSADVAPKQPGPEGTYDANDRQGHDRGP